MISIPFMTRLLPTLAAVLIAIHIGQNTEAVAEVIADTNVSLSIDPVLPRLEFSFLKKSAVDDPEGNFLGLMSFGVDVIGDERSARLTMVDIDVGNGSDWYQRS